MPAMMCIDRGFERVQVRRGNCHEVVLFTLVGSTAVGLRIVGL